MHGCFSIIGGARARAAPLSLRLCIHTHTWAETWPWVWGTETKFLGSNFRMTFLGKKFKKSDLTPKNFWRPSFFSLLSEISNYSNSSPFCDQKLQFHQLKFRLKTFFSQFMLFLTPNNSNSRNIDETDAWAVPTSNLLGDHLPVPLVSAHA